MDGMLRRLRIENLVLIREAELELDAGLNAITGETGAGKTILANAFGLLLGARGDAAAIGAAAGEAYVEAEFDLPQDDVLGELAALAADPEGLEPGREDELRAARERLRHVTELAAGTAAAIAALSGEEDAGAADLAATAERAVAPLERLAPELASAGDSLRSA